LRPAVVYLRRWRDVIFREHAGHERGRRGVFEPGVFIDLG
jgi:hypothetical protein